MIRGGHYEQSIPLLREVLPELGLAFPKDHGRAFRLLLWGRLQIATRRLSVRKKSESKNIKLPDAKMNAVDVCFSLGRLLTYSDWVRGAYFSTRGTVLAIQSGHAGRIVRALTAEARLLSASNPSRRNFSKAKALLRRAMTLALQQNDPRLLGITELGRAGLYQAMGKMKLCLKAAKSAGDIFRQRCVGTETERVDALLHKSKAVVWLGEAPRHIKEFRDATIDADARNDAHGALSLRFVMTILSLYDDASEQAQEYVLQMRNSLSKQGFTLQHFFALLADIAVDLYNNKAVLAWEKCRCEESRLGESKLLSLFHVRVVWHQFRGRCGLAAAEAVMCPKTKGHYLSQVLRDAQSLGRYKTAEARAFALLLKGGIAFQRDDRFKAIQRLDDAIDILEEAGMQSYAGYASLQRARIRDDTYSEEQSEQIRAEFLARGYKDPQRLAHTFVPGFSKSR